MKCADPVLCYTDHTGKRIFRNWSMATEITKTRKHIVFDCGQCIYCRKKRAYNLACRCVLHASLYKQNCFLTLTYDEKKEGYHNGFDYTDIQKFKKSLRSHAYRNYGKRIEIFNVHEYGRNSKKHWHLIVFNFDFDDKEIYTVAGDVSLYTSERLSRIWDYGYSTIGDVSAASAMYQAQYVEKDLKNGNRHNSKKSHSKHSGIGKAYFLHHYENILQLGYIPMDGKKMPIPRYFQKIAHRHYCHYYEKSAFFDLSDRKALYRPLKVGEENLHMANLYKGFAQKRELYKNDLEQQWEEVIRQYLCNRESPDFEKSGSNALYDLKRKTTCERF